MALFVALLSLLLALVIAGAGTASAAVGVVSGDGGGDGAPSVTEVSLIPATSSAVPGREAVRDAGRAPTSVSISLVPATSSALLPAPSTGAGVAAALGFDAGAPGAGSAPPSSPSPPAGSALWRTLWLIVLAAGGIGVLAVVRRRVVPRH